MRRKFPTQVVDAWAQFETFFQDMGEKPTRKTLVRVDTDKPFSADNCRWVKLEGKAYSSGKHGQCGTPTYRVWRSLCHRRRSSVCEEWLENFEAFVRDVGERPDGLTLKRKDASKPFNRENCAWFKSHGKCNTSTYSVWTNMIQRVTNPNAKGYSDYGGRGITVCEKWLSFDGFIDDMGDKPPGCSLDRVENSQGYRKDNCRWATRREQSLNRRNTLRTNLFGGTTLLDLAERFSLPYSNLRYAFHKGKLEQYVEAKLRT